MPAPLSDAGTAVTAAAQAGAARASIALGSLIDADPALETAQLMDLQNRQSRPAGITKANRAPQTLLSLFGNA